MFIATYGLKDNNYYKELEKRFADEGLIQANIYSYIESDNNVYNYFMANGEKADFIIFSETNVNDLQDYVIYNYYNIETLEDGVPILKEFDYFLYDNVPYGVKIFDGDNDDYNKRFSFSDLIEFTTPKKDNESYYLLIDTDSPHFDKENEHTLGYSVLEYFLTSYVK